MLKSHSTCTIAKPAASFSLNEEISSLFDLTPVKPKPANITQKKCTSHRLLTTESLIAEKRIKKKEKEDKLLRKQQTAEKRKLKVLEVFMKKMK